MINNLIVLADKLDALGLKKYADKLDILVSKVAANEDFDLEGLWGELGPEDSDAEQKLHLSEETALSVPDEDPEMSPEEEMRLNRKMEGAGDNLPEDYIDPKYHRLDELKRRHEIMKLKNMLDKVDQDEAAEIAAEESELEPSEELAEEIDRELAGESSEEEDESFEDEDMSNADDGLIDALKDKLKDVPDLAMKLLTLVKDNPELLELLAL